jgi:sulfide:quinone oxidoreductase
VKQIVILGGGTAGTVMANRLAKRYRSRLRAGSMRLTVVDQDPTHVYQPGLLFVPFGDYAPGQIVRPRASTLPREAQLVRSAIERIDADRNIVELAGGGTVPYDVLIVATGSRTAPEETEGLLGPGWRETVFDFYTLDGATALREALASFKGGRVVVHVAEMPIKCPVAPLEFTFLTDAFFAKRGIREKVSLTYVTPLDGAFTKPAASKALAHLLSDKHVELVTEFNVAHVDGTSKRLVSWDDREVPFDLLVTVPVHKGADFVGRSAGLGDDMNWVTVDPRTLQATRSRNVFAIGDATNVPASKAGSVAHFEAELLTRNIERFLAGLNPEPTFDGHANCFIETGHGQALLIDFNYEVEPLPGRFPFAWGPLRLLHESRMNHWGKLFFRWVYWNLLLPGRDIPFIPARMSWRGKPRPAAASPLAAPVPAAVTSTGVH